MTGLPLEIAAQAPDLAIELITAAIIARDSGDADPAAATVATINGFPLEPQQRADLVGLIIDSLLETIVGVLDGAAIHVGTTPLELWRDVLAIRAVGG